MPTSVRMSSDERRNVILEAAVRLFAEKGFRGTTTRALAEATGVTEPVLYEHFKSKRELYCAIIEAKSREGMARGSALLQPYAEARDDRGFFTRLGAFVLDCYTGDRDYARLLLFAALEDPGLGAVFYDRQNEGRQALAAYIETRMREGVFRRGDPALAARTFLGMVAYHGMLGLLYRDNFVPVDRKQVIEGMVDVFLKGIAADGNAGQ